MIKQIFRSIFPTPILPTSETDQKRFLLKNLIFHFRPTRVPARTLSFTLSWGLGGMAAMLVAAQIASGVMLTFVYEPLPTGAYGSILSTINEVPFGRLIRNIHHWGANLLVFIIFLHILRVFFTGAFHPPRQFNWVVGWLMLSVVLFANFTGYLLPWDQLAFWAITVSTGMLEYIPWVGIKLQRLILGGEELGPATLRLFYALHTSVVPPVLAACLAFHFWRVRKAGGLVIPRAPGELPPQKLTRVSTVPNLLLRELTVAAVLCAILLLTAVFFNAPLGDPANPGLSPNPTRAPWYFGGFQELLIHFHPTVAVCVIPLGMAASIMLLPYLRYDADTSGVWFCSRDGRRTILITAVPALFLTLSLLLLNHASDNFGNGISRLPLFISSGLIPISVGLIFLAGVYLMLKKGLRVGRNEIVQGVFIFFVTTFALLTIVNLGFRGKGMQLIWPY